MIRVFPRRTKWTPTDKLSFIGDPPLFGEACFLPVRISVTFTWDIPEGERLVRSWSRFYNDVQIGGPAFGNRGEEFTPGLFLKQGAVITSRGCPKSCKYCLVPKREGQIRELRIKSGWNIFDNNLLACSRDHVEEVFRMLWHQKEPARFTGGLDKTLLMPWVIDLLKSTRIKRMWFALDNAAHFPALERAADLLSDFSREKKYCYVLVGFQQETPQEAERRLLKVYNLGFMPFSMLYRGPQSMARQSTDPSWRSLIHVWCNPARYKAVIKKPFASGPLDVL